MSKVKSRPISVIEAAEIRGVSTVAILKGIASGRFHAEELSNKGWLLSEDEMRGKKFDKMEFIRECRKWICVPDACDIMCKTDAAVIRDIKSGRVEGFRLNGRAWAVLKTSAEEEIKEYLASPQLRGRPRDLTQNKNPRRIKRKTKKKV